MSDTFTQFQRRLNTIERKHRALAQGRVAQNNPSGLVTGALKPKKPGVLHRFLWACVMGFFAFKVFVLAVVGPITYQGRIDALLAGSTLERFCAWIMQADPVSQKLATLLITAFG